MTMMMIDDDHDDDHDIMTSWSWWSWSWSWWWWWWWLSLQKYEKHFICGYLLKNILLSLSAMVYHHSQHQHTQHTTTWASVRLLPSKSPPHLPRHLSPNPQLELPANLLSNPHLPKFQQQSKECRVLIWWFYSTVHFLSITLWQGKSERSDWFFLGQDFSIRTISVETVIGCVFFYFESRQSQN